MRLHVNAPVASSSSTTTFFFLLLSSFRSSLLWAPHSGDHDDHGANNDGGGPSARGARAVRQALLELRVRWGLPAHRVLVGGFAAGGVLALTAALEHEAAADAADARSSAAAAPGHQAVYQAGEKTKPTEVEADGRRERLGSPESERVAGAFAFSAFLPASSDLWASVGVAWRRRPMPAPALGSESSESSEGSEGSDGGEELDVAALEAAALQASGGDDAAQAAREAQAVAQAEAHERRRLAKQHKAAVRAAARAAAAAAAAEAEEVLATVDPERWTLVRLAQTSGNADAADEDTRFGDDDDDTGVGSEAGAGAGVPHGVPHGVAHEVPPLPVWLGHGEADGVVPHAWGLATATALSLARRQRPKSTAEARHGSP